MSNAKKEDLSFYSVMRRHIVPLLVPVLVGIGSAAITSTITTARLEERVSTLDREVEASIRTTDALRLRDNDYERRISRTEAFMENMNTRVMEVSSDVKLLLQRSGK